MIVLTIKSHPLSPGVDTVLFRPKSQQAAKIAIGADPNHRIIVAVGRIDPIKGFDVLFCPQDTSPFSS